MKLRSALLLALAFVLAHSNGWPQPRPTLTLISNAPVRLNVAGTKGSFAQVQFSTNLATGFWTALTNFAFSDNSAVAIDPGSASTSQRYYRTVTAVPTNMLWVGPGSFVMGSPTTEADRGPNNETQHSVTLTRGFFMNAFLVTQGRYLSLTSTNPSYFNTNHGYTLDLSRPVEQVTWGDATNFCALLNIAEQNAGRLPPNFVYRLPTEAEWEYACRAGTTNVFYLGNNLSSAMANFNGQWEYASGTGLVFNSSGTFLNRTTTVGSYSPNPWGLYDMAGNAWEWCLDWYGVFTTPPTTDPTGPAVGTERVFRGGTFNATGALCRSANRNKTTPASAANTIGFRVVMALP